MITKDLNEAYTSLPEDVKPSILALSILITRIRSLPKVDQDDLFELFQELRKAEDPDTQKNIRLAMEEILAPIPIRRRPMHISEEKPMGRKLKNWAIHVGRKIRAHREAAGLTQVQLAGKAGIPQSHLSRLENAEHSATNFTLQKLATALGIRVGDLDPCAD